MVEPLSYEQLWGKPDIHNDFFNPGDDEMLEEILEADGDCFDDAHVCPECQQPYHLCTCDPINRGEDYDNEY